MTRLYALAAALLLFSGCATARSSRVVSPLLGKPAEVVAPDLEGREVRSAEAQGLVRVVDFWATWCAPCQDQLPALQALARAHRADGLRVYAVSVDEDLAQVKGYLAETPLELTVLWDKGGTRHTERFDVQRLPTTLVLDRAGVVRFVHQGYDPRNAEELAGEVGQLLAEPAPGR